MKSGRTFFRLAVPLSAALLLALGGCGSDKSDRAKRQEGPAVPLGFELAFAGTGVDADDGLPIPDPAASRDVVPVSPADLWARIERGAVRVIDVRTDAEVASGIIPDATHIPLDRLDPAALDRSDERPIVFYCRSGKRSAEAARLLAAVSGGPVEHLDGGMLAWEAARLPVDKPE